MATGERKSIRPRVLFTEFPGHVLYVRDVDAEHPVAVRHFFE